jgi:hypothetical protein
MFMLFTKRRRFGFVISGVLLTVATAPAATIFTDQSTFVATLQPGFYLENFSGFSPGDQGSSTLNFSQGAFSYTATAPQDLWINSAINLALSTTVSDNTITFNFTSGNVTAVGGFFYPSDVNENLTTGDIALGLSDGTSATLTNPGTTSFRGFTTTGGLLITSLTVSPPSSQFATVDDFYVGSVATSEAVPEPSLGAFLTLGLLLMVWQRRRIWQ